jgi:hypothetical protein
MTVTPRDVIKSSRRWSRIKSFFSIGLGWVQFNKIALCPLYKNATVRSNMQVILKLILLFSLYVHKSDETRAIALLVLSMFRQCKWSKNPEACFTLQVWLMCISFIPRSINLFLVWNFVPSSKSPDVIWHETAYPGDKLFTYIGRFVS